MKYWNLIVLIGLIGCGADSTQIGSRFFDDGDLDLTYVDSSTVRLSTVKYERLATSNTSRILIGAYQDDRLGTIKSTAYAQLAPSTSIDLQDEDIIYDYTALVLEYDDYSYYDTSALKINIYELAEEMTLDEYYIYNNSSFETKDDLLGSLTFSPRPNRDDTVEIVLSDNLGMELFQKALEGDDDLSTSDFVKYFHGIALVPEVSETSGVIGFKSTPELRVYYTDRSVTPVKQRYFALTANRYSSNIQVDRSNTAIIDLPNDERLDASETNDEAYLQSGAGLALRVDIPYLFSLKQFENIYVVQAVLEIYPVKKSYDDLKPLPESLVVYAVNNINEQQGQLANTAQLVTDAELGRNKRYQLDITSFVKSQLSQNSSNDNGLLFLNTNFTNTVNRLYAASSSYEYNTHVKIYFATVTN